MVKYLDYKKVKLPIRLSYRALKTLKGKDLSKLVTGTGTVLDDELFEDLLWAGLQSGHKAEDKQLALKKEDMEDVLDECFFEFVKLIPLFFAKPKEEGNAQPNQAVSTDSENNDLKIGAV